MQFTGKLISFEGVDGCGKSTQMALAAARLSQNGCVVVSTLEPGGTNVGRAIRELVLKSGATELSPLAELALMFAARAQHISEVILPALNNGKVILCDRFTDSTVAYQGYGRGISFDLISVLEKTLIQGLRPDLTIVLDIPLAMAANRTVDRNRSAEESPTRFEIEGLDYFSRVREGYLEISRLEPQRVRVIEGQGSVEEVQNKIDQCIDAFLMNQPQRTSNAV